MKDFALFHFALRGGFSLRPPVRGGVKDFALFQRVRMPRQAAARRSSARRKTSRSARLAFDLEAKRNISAGTRARFPCEHIQSRFNLIDFYCLAFIERT